MRDQRFEVMSSGIAMAATLLGDRVNRGRSPPAYDQSLGIFCDVGRIWYYVLSRTFVSRRRSIVLLYFGHYHFLHVDSVAAGFHRLPHELNQKSTTERNRLDRLLG